MDHLRRLGRDIKTLNRDKKILNQDGIYFHVDENDMTNMWYLIIGPKGTPYENGYYLIHLKFNESYPYKPPAGKFLTQDSRKKTRIHPNLYAGGKICLSILGTWSGPAWTPILDAKAIGLTIQSIMDDNPLTNEPGYEKGPKTHPNHVLYSDIVKFENIQYPVLDQLEMFYKNEKISEHPLYPFGEMMHRKFLENYSGFLKRIEELRAKEYEGQTKTSPCYGIETTFKLDDLQKRLEEMKPKVEAWLSELESKNQEKEELKTKSNSEEKSDNLSEPIVLVEPEEDEWTVVEKKKPKIKAEKEVNTKKLKHHKNKKPFYNKGVKVN